MKSKLKILATGMTLFLINPVFAQDATNTVTCCGQTTEITTDSNNQVGIDPVEWAAAGNENETLSNMTTMVRTKVNHDQTINQSTDPVSAVRTGKHSKKSIQSKQ